MAKTILVVFDDDVTMRQVKPLLLDGGYAVLTAANGEEGIDMARNEKPDLVVLDVILPGRNGFQICRDMKTSPDTKGVPVIMFSTKDQPSDRFWGMRQGADAYLLKPINTEDLLAAIARLI